MKIINGSFVNMLDELENFQQLASSLNHGWTKNRKRKREEESLGEEERKRRGTQKLC
jgi:hypothetical protein